MMLLQPPPDNSAYMIAGYAVIFGVMILYLVSMLIRRRNLMQDYEMLKELENKKK